MSFRQFGGLNYSATHNIVSSNYNASNNLLITQNFGQPNSYINFLSDISGNIRLYGDLDLSGNLYVSGKAVFDQDIDVNDLTVGRGGGNQLTSVAMGYQALAGSNSSGRNVAIGYRALQSNTNSQGNVAVGSESLYKNTKNGENTAIGSQALYNNSGGNAQTAVGYQALFKNSTGTENTALGNGAGLNNTGSYNTFLGTFSDASGNYSNSTAIGYMAKVTSNNQIMLGGKNPITAPTYPQVVVPGGITGATGSFQYMSSTNNTYLATSSGASVGIGFTNPNVNTALDVSGNVQTGNINMSANANLQNFITNIHDSGLFIGWNNFNGFTGETDFVNCIGSGTGGFYFWNIPDGADLSLNSPIVTFSSSGTITATSFNTTSDYRIKDNIEILNDDYNVDKLRPITYLNKKTGKQDIGLIAHELQEYFPCLVNGEKDAEELQNVNYSGLIPILIKEIQELKREMKMLKSKI